MEKSAILQLHKNLSMMAHHFKAVIVYNKNKHYDVIIQGTEGFQFLALSTPDHLLAEKEKSRIEMIVFDFYS